MPPCYCNGSRVLIPWRKCYEGKPTGGLVGVVGGGLVGVVGGGLVGVVGGGLVGVVGGGLEISKQCATDAGEARRMAGMVPWRETSATPSGVSPAQVWNAFTAAFVTGPKYPYTVASKKPRY
jgi:hypothetical protein